MKYRISAVLLAFALVGAACGTRVSEQQAIAEAREDADRAGLTGVGLASNPGASAGTGSSASGTGSATSPGSATSSATGSAGGGSSTSSGAGSAASSAEGAPAAGTAAGSAAATEAAQAAAQAPAGGNGGATDVGVTETEIKVGNVATLSGAVPGLFRGALVGTQAYFAYVNSLGGVHGRQIKVVSGDDRLDDGGNRAAHLELKDKVLAFVGSFSVNDGGGADVLKDSGVPDIGHGLALSRSNLPNNVDPQPAPPGWRSGPARLFAAKYGPDVVKKTAFFVAAVPSARQLAVYQRAVYEGEGFEVVYTREVAPNEANYTADVVQMQRQGVRTLIFNGDVGNMARMAAAMKQQNFAVDAPLWGGSAYSQAFIDQAGAPAAEGVVTDQTFAMFNGEDAGSVPAVGLFLDWMARIDPNTPVDLFALYGWTSAHLFTAALRQGDPAVTRDKLLSELRTFTNYDADGLLAPSSPGEKKGSDCYLVHEIKDAKFVRTEPQSGFKCEPGSYVYM